jgi:hypothetical protein
MMTTPQKTIDWLLAGPSWVQYRTKLDLLGMDDNDTDVQKARNAMLLDSTILELIENCSSWEQVVLKRHNDAIHPLHQLSFLAEIGLTHSDPGMESLISRITAHHSAEGPFQVFTNIPVNFGGKGQDEWSWMLCDAPLLLYCLARFGLNQEVQIKKALQTLLNLGRSNGWPCAVSPALGKFHGPGRRDDPCPYANLLMLKLLALLPETHLLPAVQDGVECILHLWEHSREKWPYLFHAGSDFRKLKLPLVWYDILHVATVLSYYPSVRNDIRLREMVDTICEKADVNGQYTPESVWIKWKGWEFAQKKAPSRWLTLMVLTLQKRMAE